MDIEGLGDKLVDQLVDANVIRTLPDLYRLGLSALVVLERMADRSALNLLAALEKSKQTTLPRFLFALGIRHVGESTAKDLAKLWHARCSDGRGRRICRHRRATAAGARRGPHRGAQRAHLLPAAPQPRVVEQLRACGVTWPEGAPPNVAAGAGGQNHCADGHPATLSRDAAKDMLEAAGAKVSGSVSKKPAMWWLVKTRAASWPRPKNWACPCWTRQACWRCWRARAVPREHGVVPCAPPCHGRHQAG